MTSFIGKKSCATLSEDVPTLACQWLHITASWPNTSKAWARSDIYYLLIYSISVPLSWSDKTPLKVVYGAKYKTILKKKIKTEFKYNLHKDIF